jgi:cell wall-associated NlpC family hydrolase
MRFHSKCAMLFVMFCLAAISTAPAQQKQKRSHQAPRVTRREPELQPGPLTLDEGLAIISAALDSRHHAKFKSDCSHFVHGLYDRAGFHYTYAPSADLYAGIEGFERVTNPQPGDLAVWRSHAGIVINPSQHSFFSLLRSGAGVASYDSLYWRTKGRPRFFRYVRTVPADDRSDSRWTASR